MQAVILAAGKSTRTYPLTITKPKPLLKVANKPIIEHNLENLKDFVSESIIVVGYKKNLIKSRLGNKYKNIKIRYVEQKQQLGTAHALSLTQPYIKDGFILLMGDDVYQRKDIKNCIKHRYSILTAKVSDPQNFGVVIEKGGIFIDVLEKPKKFISSLVSTAFYSLDKKIFGYIKKIKKSKRNELELPDAIKLLSKQHSIHIVKTERWFPIVYPWDLLNPDRYLRKNKALIGNKSKVFGKVENSSIGDGCIINGIVKNSIIMDKTKIEKDSIVKDSIIGEKVYFKGRVISKRGADYAVKNKRANIHKWGAVIGDNVKAINVTINAGCRIWPNKTIKNKTVSEDLL